MADPDLQIRGEGRSSRPRDKGCGSSVTPPLDSPLIPTLKTRRLNGFFLQQLLPNGCIWWELKKCILLLVQITEVYRSKLSLRPSKESQAKIRSFETYVFNITSSACQNVSYHILRLSIGLEDVVTFRPWWLILNNGWSLFCHQTRWGTAHDLKWSRVVKPSVSEVYFRLLTPIAIFKFW